MQYNTIQYNAIQCNTIQYNAMQYNTMHTIYEMNEGQSHPIQNGSSQPTLMKTKLDKLIVMCVIAGK
jgi:hypothetical protein